MKSILVSAAILMTIMLPVGCATSTVGPSGRVVVTTPPAERPAEPPADFTPPPALPRLSQPSEVAEPVPAGEVDWSGNTIRARGTGVIDPGTTNPAQARLMAERAAVVVAQRNLLEIIKGVRVDSETRVENFMTDYDVVYSRVDGVVKGARQLGPARFDDAAGIVQVELEIDLYAGDGLSGAVQPGLDVDEVMASGGLSEQTREFLRQYSALVFDGGASGLKPALYPKIYDEDGNLLLDTKQYASYIGSGGQNALQFIQDLDRVLSRPEIARNALVVKVRQVTGKLGGDIVIGRQDAGRLKWLKDGFQFLVGAGRLLLRVLL